MYIYGNMCIYIYILLFYSISLSLGRHSANRLYVRLMDGDVGHQKLSGLCIASRPGIMSRPFALLAPSFPIAFVNSRCVRQVKRTGYSGATSSCDATALQGRTAH